MYLKVIVTKWQRGHTQFSHLLKQSKGHQGQGWARPNRRTKSSCPHIGRLHDCQFHTLELPLAAFPGHYQASELEAVQMELELLPIWDADIADMPQHWLPDQHFKKIKTDKT